MPVNSFDHYPLSWKPVKHKDNMPLYISLANQLEQDILSGKLPPNTMLPPQRELADYLDINLSTITRSFKLCELKGLIYATVGRGTYVSPNAFILKDTQTKTPVSIDLCHIEPFHETNPYVSKAVQNIMSRPSFEEVLEYHANKTDSVHKYAAMKLLQAYGVRVQPENLLITAGSQNALSILLLSLFSAGDKLAVDTYTYHHFKTLANYLHIQLLPVASDDSGILPDKLADLCRLNHISGIYLMPSCNNPTTVQMPLERRSTLCDVIRRYQLIIIEDDSYAFLSDQHIPTFYELAPSQTIHIQSTSKSLCAGLRVAFMAFDEKYAERLSSGSTSINLRISPFDTEIISELIMSDRYLDMMNEKKRLSQQRNSLYLSLFTEHNPYHNPNSYFRWLKLPDGKDCNQVISLAANKGIYLMGSNQFSIGPGSSASYLRIALSTPKTEEELIQGLKLLYHILY